MIRIILKNAYRLLREILDIYDRYVTGAKLTTDFFFDNDNDVINCY